MTSEDHGSEDHAPEAPPSSELVVEDLNVYYGQVHILQDVSLRVGREPVAMIGRNGMGKTTLAKALVGMLRPRSGSVRFDGAELIGRDPYKIVQAGIGYVPQGRRIFPSLTTHEHLEMVGAPAGARWTADGVYDLFPRLADRRRSGAANLSGGEQQMLAIGRALLTNPKLLLMDEPSEGLAPTIIDQLAESLAMLNAEGEAIFLIEQNLRFATAVSDQILVLVNGRIEAELTAAALLHDHDAQARYLGVA